MSENYAQTDFDVRTYGARGDGEHPETEALQAAIDACGSAGGGRVLVRSGVYRTGTLEMRSGVRLHLAANAALLGSRNLEDYPSPNRGNIEDPAFDRVLLYAEGARSIAISGEGTIDGSGSRDHFPTGRASGRRGQRPMLIRFVECERVTIEGVRLADAASWCCHLVSCDTVRIDGVVLDSRVNVNNDGFDLDGCRDVHIANCTISSGDDSICLKSTTERPTERVTVTNCIVSSNTAAVKLGTSSKAGFRDIVISNCVFHDCRMGAIKLLMVDGGELSGLTITGIVMRNVEGPLFIRLGNRGNEFRTPQLKNDRAPEEPAVVPVGAIRDILISDIQATVYTDDLARAGIMLTGIPGHAIENVCLRGIRLSLPGGGTPEDAARQVPEDESRYPEQFFFGTLPSYGVFARHVRNLSLSDIHVHVQRPDARPAMSFEDVVSLRIRELTLAGNSETVVPFVLRRARSVSIDSIIIEGHERE